MAKHSTLNLKHLRKLEFSGYTKDGKFHLRNKKQFEVEIAKFTNSELWVTFEKKSSKRSDQANRYYFGVCVTMIQERFKELGTDCSKDDVHCFLKSKFLYNEVLIDDEVIQMPRSTTELNKSEFSEYINKIQIFAAETLDVFIPDANEQLTII